MPAALAALALSLFFSAVSAATNVVTELPKFVADINKISGYSFSISGMAVLGDKLYVGSTLHNRFGTELVSLNANGEHELAADIYKGDSSSSPKSLCACNEKLYFRALRPDGDSSLLVFDPATNETRMLPSQYSGGRFTVSGMTELDGEMIFSANDPADYRGKLWAMDASEAMRLVHDFPDTIGSPFGGGPKDFAVLHDTLFFRAMTDVPRLCPPFVQQNARRARDPSRGMHSTRSAEGVFRQSLLWMHRP
tara:strand:- start:248 stop:1000 length:753 start_codon:yes stop_codon:yes gene_type:complete